MRTAVFIRGCPPGVRVHVFTKDPRLTDDAFCRARDKSPDVAVQIYQKDVRIEGLAVMLWLAVLHGSAIDLDAIEEEWLGHVDRDAHRTCEAVPLNAGDVPEEWRRAGLMKVPKDAGGDSGVSHPKNSKRCCAMCDAWYDPATEAAEHAHVLPRSGPLRDRWIASGLAWDKFHDIDSGARSWGHREALS